MYVITPVSVYADTLHARDGEKINVNVYEFNNVRIITEWPDMHEAIMHIISAALAAEMTIDEIVAYAEEVYDMDACVVNNTIVF